MKFVLLSLFFLSKCAAIESRTNDELFDQASDVWSSLAYHNGKIDYVVKWQNEFGDIFASLCDLAVSRITENYHSPPNEATPWVDSDNWTPFDKLMSKVRAHWNNIDNHDYKDGNMDGFIREWVMEVYGHVEAFNKKAIETFQLTPEQCSALRN